MSSTTANLWDEVWAEYDARLAPAPAAAQPLDWQASANRRAQPLAQPLAQPVARRAGWWAAALLAVGLSGYAAMPVLASQHLTAALDADDAAGVAAMVDWPAVQASLSGDLAAATHALPPGRTAGLSGAGLDYLQGMAREVSAGMATAEGLANLLRRRLGVEGGAPLASAQLQPEGLTRTRVVLAAADGGSATVSMTLALTDPLRLRWQVVAVQLAD